MENNELEVLERIEAQLEALNSKMERLIKQSSEKPAERNDFSEKSYSSKRSYSRSRDFDDRGGNAQHKAVCSECGKSCEVPFKPTGKRPIFCSDCFSNQRDGGGEEQRFRKKPRDFRKSSPSGGKKPFYKKR